MKKAYFILIIVFIITCLSIISYSEQIDVKNISLCKNKNVLIILKNDKVLKIKITEVTDRIVIGIDKKKKKIEININDIDKIFIFEHNNKNKKAEKKNKKDYTTYNEMMKLKFPLDEFELKHAKKKSEQLTEEEKRTLYNYHKNEKSSANLACLFNVLLMGCGIGNLYQGDYKSFALCIGGDLFLISGIIYAFDDSRDERNNSRNQIGLSIAVVGLVAIVVSFFMPYRYNSKINNQIEEVFIQKENHISKLPQAKGFRTMISESDINVKKGMNNKHNISFPVVILDF